MYSVLYAANNGAFDVVPLEKIEAAREACCANSRASTPN
jgi:hypothetical protein